MKKAIAVFLAASAAICSHAQMDRSRLNIGAYILQPYASSEAHVRDVAGCGIDFIVCMRNDRATLDLFSKYRVGAIVTGIVPGWWGGDGDNAGKLAEKNPMEKYEAAAKAFKDHPAIWGIDVGDEPSALDFPAYGRIIKRMGELFPGKAIYLNLYPNYASVAQNTSGQTVNQLGTATYAEHIAEYCKNVPSDYICYDFYLYSAGVPKSYENLRIVADACAGTKRSMWIVLQVNSNDPAKWISENELRFQAYGAMAFGAENIIWACYTAGWWHNQVVDEKGRKTAQYEKLRKVNAELRRIGGEYMRYRRVATSFTGFGGTKWLEGVKQASEAAFGNGVFSALRAADGAPLVVGSMVSRSGDGSYAAFVFAADDPYDKAPKTHEISFRADGRKVSAFGGKGAVEAKKQADGSYSLALPSSEGVLIRAE